MAGTRDEVLCLIDEETNEEFDLIVTSADATRARNDSTFAMQLLQQARTQRISCTTSQASPSSSQISSTSSNKKLSV
ncbi:uncharacterized protein [Linepithema humile]|uniref:uncharacterized protein n=1 Tax=Linepithema humile TaxID=83485 RepID=UPI00351E23DF